VKIAPDCELCAYLLPIEKALPFYSGACLRQPVEANHDAVGFRWANRERAAFDASADRCGFEGRHFKARP